MLELTCGSCRNSPATHLIVADLDARRMVRAEQLTCKPCADRAAADARPGDWVRLYRLVPEEGMVTEWGARFRDEAGHVSAMAECGRGPEGEQTARSIAGTSRRDNLTGIVFCREVGPWKEVPEGVTE